MNHTVWVRLSSPNYVSEIPSLNQYANGLALIRQLNSFFERFYYRLCYKEQNYPTGMTESLDWEEKTGPDLRGFSIVVHVNKRHTVQYLLCARCDVKKSLLPNTAKVATIYFQTKNANIGFK